MKKLILSLVVASCATGAFAQTNLAGSVLLYGTGGFTSTHGSNTDKISGISTTNDRARTRDYIIAPGLGYSINNHLTVGVNFGYVGSKWDSSKGVSGSGNLYEIKNREFGVGPFVRYTQMLGEHFFVFGQLNVNYLNGKTTNYYNMSGSSSSTEDTWNGVSANYFPAVGVMFGKSCALSFSIGGIGYTYRKFDYDNGGLPNTEFSSKQSSFDVTIGQQFNLGVQKYFGCGRGHHKMKGHHEMMDDTRMMDTKDDEEESDMPKRKARKDSDD